MKKMRIGDLEKIRDRYLRTARLRREQARARLTVHMGTCGIVAGAEEIMSVLMDEIEKYHLKDVWVATSGCAGLCSREPMMTVEMRGEAPVKYGELTPVKLQKILHDHVLEGQIVTKYALAMGSEHTY